MTGFGNHFATEAVPGALPPMIGWAAARGALTPGAWALFAIVFVWQIPHFMAIAWLYRADYAKGGYQMLSVVDPTGHSAGRQAVAAIEVYLQHEREKLATRREPPSQFLILSSRGGRMRRARAGA